ncbi:probable cysteine--tRNA ligase, mitochondrial [Anoplophora glabripennis]|uniref:probable cysteine--tRNA ligase, mitochondrial n=1 Tax=Anoplophora glabripennis TaxID=217634 RepID=UPI000873B9EF|nr:probable cysteine--tRNA ligase, mitochondrial [Anoplophora glabripennis]
MLICKQILKVQKCFLKFHPIHTWTKPEGFDTKIKVYNCITRNKEPLVIRDKHLITWYTCGPTVYDSSHIGHASCYVKLDIIQKILQNYFKYNLITVMNITDIDDKIIRRAIQMKKTYKDVAKMYEKEFFEDLKSLGIAKPNIILRVTDNMDIIIDFIKQLESNGQTYMAKDNSVYFSVENDNYGKLVNINEGTKQQTKKGVKKNDMDFVLWKESKEGEPYWNSPWGSGRPGWHIECSALASHVLGSNIDIHAGGMDLKFPHHENEEAQSCSYHKTEQWVNYWIHIGHLHLKNSEKMSKSLKNTVSIQEMLQEVKTEVFRLACAMSHYKSGMEYSKELLETSQNVYQVYKNLIISCNDYINGHLKATINNDVLLKVLGDSYSSVHNALCDDFDTPSVIRTLNELVSVTNSMLHTTTSSNNQIGLSSVAAVSNFLSGILTLFGVDFDERTTRSSENFIEVMNILNDFRQDVRLIGIEKKDKDILKLCDNIREQLKENNIVVRDYTKTSSWSR